MSYSSNAKRITAALLRMAAEQYSNHGCNDYELESTQDNFDFALNAYRLKDWDDPDIHMIDGKLWVLDTYLMEYAAYLLEAEAAQMERTV